MAQLRITWQIFHMGASTVNGILHHGIDILMHVLVPLAIKFPAGAALQQDMREFEKISGLPMCCGAMDGTFMKIRKPMLWGDAFGVISRIQPYLSWRQLIVMDCSHLLTLEEPAVWATHSLTTTVC